MASEEDTVLLAHATTSGQVIVTHDRDFGRHAIAGGAPVFETLYLRPGHIRPEFTLETLESLVNEGLDVSPPFLIVAERLNNRVRIRVRQL